MLTNLYWRSFSLFPLALFLFFLLSLWPQMESSTLDVNYTSIEELNSTYQTQDLKVNNSHGNEADMADEATNGLNSHNTSIAPSTSTINYIASTPSVSVSPMVPQRNAADKEYVSTTTMFAEVGGFSKSQFQNNSDFSRNTNDTTQEPPFDFSLSGTGTIVTTGKDDYSTVTSPSNSITDTRISLTGTISLTTNGNTSPQTKYTENYRTSQNSATSLGADESIPTPETAETVVDECQGANHCLRFSHCVSLYKSFICECELGFYYHQLQGCIPARTFFGQLFLPIMPFEEKMSIRSSKEFRKVQVMVESIFKAALNSTDGYLSTIVTDLKPGSVKVTVLNYFSLLSTVTEDITWPAVKRFIQGCENLPTGWEILKSNGTDYQSHSICKLDVCDNRTTSCEFREGIVWCNCLQGYFRYSEMDRSCKACESGFQLKDGLCVRCPFGFSGFNCNEWFLLLLVIIAGSAGPVLLSLLITVIILSCRRNKPVEKANLFYKNENFGMSPPTMVPKLPRVRPPWTLETIELHENGSQSDLLRIQSEQLSPVSVHSLASEERLSTFAGPENVENPYVSQGQQNPAFFSED